MMIALNDRAIVTISGDGAEDFLQNLITTNVPNIIKGGCHAGALLTPQGKIQFEFVISWHSDQFFIETSRDQIDALLKRLIMYRLRLPLQIEKQDGLYIYATQERAPNSLRDYRFQRDIYRRYETEPLTVGDATWFQDAMIEDGVAQVGVDFALNDVFPHDINFDQIGGMSFSKGCYVGQEVISRMHHKGGVRKRLMVVTADTSLDMKDDTTLTIEGKSIGNIGHISGQKALAICRIDKASKAIQARELIMLGTHEVHLTKPMGAAFTFPIMSGSE